MTGKETKLTTFTMASDYDPAHYNWTEEKLAALGDYKATAEVIKKRLEDNDVKVKEMYVIEHKSEKKADKKSKEYHNSTDETKPHYHILVKLEHGATLKEIAEYVGVLPNIIEKLPPGGHSYDGMLAYLVHIKYKSKIQYAPEDVVTLAGTDYMVYFNTYKARWEKARDIVAKNGGKPLDRHFREVMAKLHDGKIVYDELRRIKEYRELLKNPKYSKKLLEKAKSMGDLANQDYVALLDKIEKKEITSLDEIVTSEEWELAYKYHKNMIEDTLRMSANKK